MFIKALSESEIAPGGMRAVELDGREIVVCEYSGAYYAVARACGHAGARLERGALTGWILTCPLHFAQFDIRSGEALSGPVPKAPAGAHPAPRDPALKTSVLRTWPARAVSGWIYVDID